MKKQQNNRGRAVQVIVAIAAVVVFSIIAYVLSNPNPNYNLNSEFNSTYLGIISANNTPLESGGAYLAVSLAQQTQGYMNQSSLGNCDGKLPCIGMLFWFNQSTNQCFWMENTKIPLKQAWINQNYTVTEIYNATPYSTAVICHPGQMVLETSINQTIKVGDKIGIGIAIP